MDARKRLGANIKRERERNHLTQEALAYRCDVHPTEISRVERAVRDPRFSTILRIARALEVAPADLLDGIA